MVHIGRTSLKGRRAIFAAALVLLFLVHVVHVTPARQRQRRAGRRLSEDAALSAALDGLPVSPSAKSQATPAVNVYGLDPSLLAALQQNGANATSGQPGNRSSSSAPIPGPSLAQSPMTATSSSSSSQSPGLVRSSSVGWPGPGAAPEPSAWNQSPQSAPVPGPAQARSSAPLPPPRSNYAPLDPHLAAALENQGRVPPASTTPSPTAAPPRNATAAGSSASIVPAAAPAPLGATAPQAAASPAYAPVAAPEASASPAGVQQDEVQQLCSDKAWQASSLKLLQERPFASLFSQELNQTVFDPTGLEQINMNYYVVFKSSQTLAYIPNRLAPMDDSNKLVAISSSINKTSFGGIAAKRDAGGLLAVQERRISDATGEELRPIIHELQVAGDLKSYKVQRNCAVAFNLSQSVTGFQDIQIHYDDQGNKFLLGLCDGNHCAGGQHGRDRGNGRIIVSRMKEDSTRCAWVPEKVISIPATAAFTQYSGIAIRSNRMLIASQEDSAVWLGVVDWESWEFKDEGDLYHLPRNEACEMVYCNIAAVQWLDDRRITVASGVALPGGPWACFSKAESLHQFLLPASAVLDAKSAR